MWSIDKLKQLTHDAKVKAEQERQRQAELARLEALEREKAAQLYKEELARQKKVQQEADDLHQKILVDSITAAANLERSFVIASQPPVVQLFAHKLKDVGISLRALGPVGQHLSNDCYAAETAPSKRHDLARPKALSKLNGLLHHMSDIRYEHHKTQVIEWINAYEMNGGLSKVMRKIENTIALIREEFQLIHQDPMIAYFNLNLKPLLDREHDTEDDPGEPTNTAYRVTLNPREPRDALMTAFADLPTWMLGTSGSGLMRNIMLHAEAEARAGHNELRLSLVQADPNASRWGNNQMHKVMKGDEPIGVTPFQPELLAKGLEIIGFNSWAESSALTLGW